MPLRRRGADYWRTFWLVLGFVCHQPPPTNPFSKPLMNLAGWREARVFQKVSGKSKWGLANGGLRYLSTIVHDCLQLPSFCDESSLQKWAPKATNVHNCRRLCANCIDRRCSWTVQVAICLNHFVLIAVCSAEFSVVCLRICTGFKEVSFRETHLREHFGRTDQIALITYLKKLNVSGACLNWDFPARSWPPHRDNESNFPERGTFGPIGAIAMLLFKHRHLKIGFSSAQCCLGIAFHMVLSQEKSAENKQTF